MAKKYSDKALQDMSVEELKSLKNSLKNNLSKNNQKTISNEKDFLYIKYK